MWPVRLLKAVLATLRSIAQPVYRFFAWSLLLVAALALIHDVTQAQLPQAPAAWTSIEDLWLALAPASHAAAIAAVTGKLHGLVWDALLAPLLRWPMALTLGLLAVLFFWLGRQRQQIVIFTN